MIIQSGYGVLAYNMSSRVAPQQQGGNVTKTSLADSGKNADQVTLSSAGKALAAEQNNMTQPRTPAQEKLLLAASSDRESAEKIAYGMADTPSAIVWSIRGQPGVDGATGTVAFGTNKLATTGEIVDDNYIEQFNNKVQAIDAKRRAIYDAEKAKGTDPLEILSKMIDFTNSQSKDYLEATGWGWQGSTPPG